MNTSNNVGSSYFSSSSTETQECETALTLLNLRDQAGNLGNTFLRSLEDYSLPASGIAATTSLGSLNAYTLENAFSSKRRTFMAGLSEYVLEGDTGEEVQERYFVADILKEAFLNRSPVVQLHFENITELPRSIGLLTNLEILDLSGCVSLNKLPDVLDLFPCLTRLEP